MTYEIIAINKQGASETHRAPSRAAIERWFNRTWSDPQNLQVRVRNLDESRYVGFKGFGRKRIKWENYA